jgi:hypothetical protein
LKNFTMPMATPSTSRSGGTPTTTLSNRASPYVEPQARFTLPVARAIDPIDSMLEAALLVTHAQSKALPDVAKKLGVELTKVGNLSEQKIEVLTKYRRLLPTCAAVQVQSTDASTCVLQGISSDDISSMRLQVGELLTHSARAVQTATLVEELATQMAQLKEMLQRVQAVPETDATVRAPANSWQIVGRGGKVARTPSAAATTAANSVGGASVAERCTTALPNTATDEKRRERNVLAFGVPEEGGDAEHITKILQHMNNPVSQDSIKSVRRVGRPSTEKPRAILIELVDRAARTKVLCAASRLGELHKTGQYIRLEPDLTRSQLSNRAALRPEFDRLRRGGMRPYWRDDELWFWDQTKRTRFVQRASINTLNNTSVTQAAPVTTTIGQDDAGAATAIPSSPTTGSREPVDTTSPAVTSDKVAASLIGAPAHSEAAASP